MTGVTAQADAPQAVIIRTNITFAEPAFGTFTATLPLCASGTAIGRFVATNPSVAHGWTVAWEYTSDDNTGTFQLQYHPQFHADPDFLLTGPWSVVGPSTGRYAKLSGHGDFGVVIVFDENGIPQTGEETFVGFVQLK
jgi:hypothetical protein